jgi:ABC-type phosphate/phosphonate transport system permease subunit
MGTAPGTSLPGVPATPISSIKAPGEDLKTERYKYILSEIHSLNENVHKYVTLFQTLGTAVVGTGVAVFVAWNKLEIKPEIARTAIQGVVGLLVILALFTIVSIIAGMFSWLDYRREEVELLSAMVAPDFRKQPKLRNFWRWNETWIIAFIVIIVAGMVWFAERRIIPLIH